MLSAALDLILANLGPVLEMVPVALVGFALLAAKRLPYMLLSIAKNFAEEAKKTETEADDVAAKFLVAFAEALVSAAEKEIRSKSKKKPGA